MKNAVKEKLQSGARAIGTFYTMGSTAVVECLGIAGFDYLIVDTEHSPMETQDINSAIIAAERRGMSPFVRVRAVERASVLKALDCGAAGLIVPCVNSVEEVEKLIGFAKYAPIGSRGFGIVRASGFGQADYAKDTKEYFALSNRETLLLPQCETLGCLEQIDKIVALEGVDGIFVGPYDLSVALGVPGQMDDARLNEAIQLVQRVCAENGKLSFIFAGNAATAKKYFALGYSSVACNIDAALLTQVAKSLLDTIVE
ncbi:hypothetical protein LJC42_04000 [Eubacteriales bacterium OttesenSCG-928-K08]|nr:hypothetical protein [Eubacteriales bacterium OttesenSCG-928-K08]